MVCTVVNLLTVPINVGCALISVGCTAINGVLTAANGAIVVVNLTLSTINGAWLLTKITYHGTKKVVEVSFVPLKVIAQVFETFNRKQKPVFVGKDSTENLAAQWMSDAVIVADTDNAFHFFTKETESLYPVVKKEEYTNENWLEEAVILLPKELEQKET